MIVCENSCKPWDCLPELNINATVTNTGGRPNVTVVRDKNNLTFAFSGLKGSTGANGTNGTNGRNGENGVDGSTGKTPEISANATYDQSAASSEPHVHVDVNGDAEHPVFNFRFSGLKGRDGVDGQDGRDGRDGIDGLDAKAEDIEREVRNQIEQQLEDMDADMQTLSWLKYAIDGHEDNKQAFARLIAAAREYRDAGKTKLDQAYAGVNALVEKQQDGSYKATSFLTSLVSDISSEGYSGIITSADIHDAMVDVFARYTNDANTMTARIFALANANGSAIKLKADQIDLNGQTWADVINFDTRLANAFSENGQYANIEIDANSITAHGSRQEGHYDDVTTVSSNGVLVTQNSRGLQRTTTINPGGFDINISSSSIPYNVTSTSDINVTAPNVSINGTLTLTDGNETVTLDVNTLKALIQLANNQ